MCGVLFDFVVLNIAMVHAIIIQVNITLEEVKVKEGETAEVPRNAGRC